MEDRWSNYSRVELYEAISKVKFLTKPQEIKDYEFITSQIDKLRKLTAQKMTKVERDEVCKMLNEYALLCKGM